MELEIFFNEIKGFQTKPSQIKQTIEHNTTHNSCNKLNDEMLTTFPPSWGTRH